MYASNKVSVIEISTRSSPRLIWQSILAYPVFRIMKAEMDDGLLSVI